MITYAHSGQVVDEDEEGKCDVHLEVPHYYSDCGCAAARFVSVKVRDTIYGVSVPTCRSLYGGRPVRDAMDAIEDASGYRIIHAREAEALVGKFSTLGHGAGIPRDLCVDPVAESGFNNAYYLWREVIQACLKTSRAKCPTCGSRKCDDKNHALLKGWGWEHPSRLLEQSGFVYVLLHAATGLVKVGYSGDTKKRIQSHKAAIPGDLTVLGTVIGGRYLEQTIHEEISAFKAPGHAEWFYYAPFVQRYITALLSHEPLRPKPTLLAPDKRKKA